MRDEEDGTWVVHEVALEPDEGEKVQVVCGLIKHEEVWLLDEESG